MKYLISLLFTINFLNASMLLDSKNICIDDFYYTTNQFNYLDSKTQTWFYFDSTNINLSKSIIPNFIYDIASDKCSPNSAFILGMQETEYNFLLGIVGLILGAVFMFFTIQIFITVGGRR
ncbi:hypothetical protein [Sulfurimonas sp.]|uniref:hypothetical protein n=1 Tax=Sulfurimonas sp. TaxID=2022749 RepID=UPI0019DC9977|nr:hypothetical protein [Sulfurimonas sp.]MBE0515514.1 hypothetical protein [Sulfurimonas sp.]